MPVGTEDALACPGAAGGYAWANHGPGFVDPMTNKVVFSYAHPIFWAAFSLVGDGGGEEPSS